MAKCPLPAPFVSLVKISAHFSVLGICKLNCPLCSFPNNPLLQILLLTDPEIESSLLISSDEGATYQKYRLNFYIQSLLFHPQQEDWILAYSQDQKVSMSASFETIAHGSPSKSLLDNHPCISSLCSFFGLCSSLNYVSVG